MDANAIRVLAIDDQRDNLTTLEAVLTDALPGCTLVTASDGPRGISLALDTDPDAILLDILMPSMDGYEVCRRLKAEERLRDIPVIFLTAMGTDRETRVKALEAGAEALLSKPPDEQELVAQLRIMAKLKTANRMRRLERDELAARVAERTVELRESLERFDQLAEQSRTIIWEVNTAGLYTFVSPAAMTVWGFPPEELVGQRHFYDLHPAEGREGFKAGAFAAFARQEPLRDLENPVQTKDGRVVWMTTNGMPLLDDRGALRGYRGSDADITERKRAEAGLRASELKYRSLIECSSDAIFCVDERGQYQFTNHVFASTFGKSPDYRVWDRQAERGRHRRGQRARTGNDVHDLPAAASDHGRADAAGERGETGPASPGAHPAGGG